MNTHSAKQIAEAHTVISELTRLMPSWGWEWNTRPNSGGWASSGCILEIAVLYNPSAPCQWSTNLHRDSFGTASEALAKGLAGYAKDIVSASAEMMAVIAEDAE